MTGRKIRTPESGPALTRDQHNKTNRRLRSWRGLRKENSMNSRLTRVLMGFLSALILIFSGCGGSSSNTSQAPQTGQVSMLISDDPTNDWATVGVKVLSISLKPQGGGTPVVVFTAPNPPLINLVELDQLAEIIG